MNGSRNENWLLLIAKAEYNGKASSATVEPSNKTLVHYSEVPQSICVVSRCSILTPAGL
jgi:hypothetical protein